METVAPDRSHPEGSTRVLGLCVGSQAVQQHPQTAGVPSPPRLAAFALLPLLNSKPYHSVPRRRPAGPATEAAIRVLSYGVEVWGVQQFVVEGGWKLTGLGERTSVHPVYKLAQLHCRQLTHLCQHLS